MYWVNISDIDLAGTAANVTSGVLSAYVMLAAATFELIEFDRESAFYTFTYTDDADTYDILITAIFEGKDAARAEVLRAALGCCDIVVHTVDQSCVERVVGMEFQPISGGTDTMIEAVRRLRIGRHLDASGQKGTDKARDEMDIIGLHQSTPLYSDAFASGDVALPLTAA